MARLKPKKLESFAFTLQVEATLDSAPSKRGRSADKLRLSLDLNPHNAIGDTKDLGMDPRQIEMVFKFITSKLFPTLEKASKERGQDFRKIKKIVFKQNSPGTAEVSYNETFNGDLQPPPHFP